MTRARPVNPALLLIRSLDRLDIHDVPPMRPVIVGDNQRHRRAGRISVTYAADNLRRILLDLHPAPSSVSLLAAGQFKIKLLEVQLQIAGQTFNNRRKLGTVRFPGSQVT
ncbi:hypothetical protein D1872_285030 [compost metagenome]